MRNFFRKHKRKHEGNNQGLTLIEMVITVAIIGVVSVVVLSVVSTGANFYRGVSSSTRSQRDLQQLMDDVENIIMDANQNISLTGSSGGGMTLTIENRYPVSWYKDILEWVPSEKKVYYTRKTNATEGVYQKISRSAICENVTDFSLDISKAETDSTVEFSATVSNRGKEDSGTCTVHLRNKVKIKK